MAEGWKTSEFLGWMRIGATYADLFIRSEHHLLAS